MCIILLKKINGQKKETIVIPKDLVLIPKDLATLKEEKQQNMMLDTNTIILLYLTALHFSTLIGKLDTSDAGNIPNFHILKYLGP